MFVSTAKVSIKREILCFGQKYLPKGLAIPKESATFAVSINLHTHGATPRKDSERDSCINASHTAQSVPRKAVRPVAHKQIKFRPSRSVNAPAALGNVR